LVISREKKNCPRPVDIIARINGLQVGNTRLSDLGNGSHSHTIFGDDQSLFSGVFECGTLELELSYDNGAETVFINDIDVIFDDCAGFDVEMFEPEFRVCRNNSLEFFFHSVLCNSDVDISIVEGANQPCSRFDENNSRTITVSNGEFKMVELKNFHVYENNTVIVRDAKNNCETFDLLDMIVSTCFCDVDCDYNDPINIFEHKCPK